MELPIQLKSPNDKKRTRPTRLMNRDFPSSVLREKKNCLDNSFLFLCRMKWFEEDLKNSSSTILTGAGHSPDLQSDTTSFAQNLFLQQTSGRYNVWFFCLFYVHFNEINILHMIVFPFVETFFLRVYV